MQALNSIELDQLVDSHQVEDFLQPLAEIVPLAIRVEDSSGQILADARPARLLAEQAGGEDRSSVLKPLGALAGEEVARVPIEIHGEQVGYVVGLAPGLGKLAPPAVEAAVRLAAQILADQAYKEHELNSLSTELIGKYEEITLLYDLSQALGSVFDIPTICEIALEKATQAVPAAKAFIMLTDESSEYLTVVAARVDGLVGRRTPVGQGISGRVAEAGKPILLYEGEPAPCDAVQGYAPRDAVLAVPLTLSTGEGEDRVLGVLTVAGKPSGGMFTAGDLKLLTTIATQAATAIHNSRLVEAQRAAERVRQEMEIAARIQQSLLPDRPPEVPGLQLVGHCVPAANVGGDYYDLLTDEAGCLNLVIADVSGHSVGAALMMAMARSILRREITQGKSPAAVLADTNTAMLHDLSNAGLFITMFCARYDPATRRLIFANGGHNPPILQRASDGQLVGLDADGLIIGVLDDVAFEEPSITLNPGDVLLLYTDGIVEARGPDGEQFGEERLQALLTRYNSLPPAALADRIYDAVREHSQDVTQQDDITLLILKVQATAISDQ